MYPKEAIPDSPGGGGTKEHEAVPVPVLPEMAQVKKILTLLQHHRFPVSVLTVEDHATADRWLICELPAVLELQAFPVQS